MVGADLGSLLIVSLHCQREALNLMASHTGSDPLAYLTGYFSGVLEHLESSYQVDSSFLMYSQTNFSHLLLGQNPEGVRTNYLRVIGVSSIKGALGPKLLKSWYEDGLKHADASPSFVVAIKGGFEKKEIIDVYETLMSIPNTTLLGDLDVSTVDKEKVTLSAYDPTNETFSGYVAGDLSYSLARSRLLNSGAEIMAKLFVDEGTSIFEKIFSDLAKDYTAESSNKMPNERAARSKSTATQVDTEQEPSDNSTGNEVRPKKSEHTSSSNIGQALGNWAKKLFEPQTFSTDSKDSWAIQDDSDAQVAKFKSDNEGSVLADVLIASYFGRALRLYSETVSDPAQKNVPAGISFHLITVKDIGKIRKWIKHDADKALVKKFLLEKVSSTNAAELFKEVWPTDIKKSNESNPSEKRRLAGLDKSVIQSGWSWKVAHGVGYEIVVSDTVKMYYPSINDFKYEPFDSLHEFDTTSYLSSGTLRFVIRNDSGISFETIVKNLEVWNLDE